MQNELKGEILLNLLIPGDVGHFKNKDLIILVLMVGNEPFHLDFQKLLKYSFKTLKVICFIIYLWEHHISIQNVDRSSVKVTHEC